MSWELIRQEVGTKRAGEDMTAARGRAVVFNSLDRWQIAGLAGPLAGQAHGVLTNNPLNGDVATVQVFGVVEALLGGVVTGGRYLDVDANGALIENNPDGQVGIAMESGIAGSIIAVLLVNRAAAGSAPTAHGTLLGLAADDHPQYHDGSLAYTGALDMGAFDITNVGLVDGVDISVFSAAMAAHVADTDIHFSDAPADGTPYSRQDNSWVAGGGGVGDHGALTGLADDDHLQYALLAGRAGGQTLFGGTNAGGDLVLQGRDDTVLGIINVNSPMVFGPYIPSGQAYAFQYNANEGISANFIGGGLNMSGNITFQQPTFIYESFRGSPTINSQAVPGFAAYTVLQALPALIAGFNAGENPVAPLCFNAGPRVTNPWAGTRTTSSMAAMNFSPTVNPAVNGATMTVGSITGLTYAPVWNTVTGSIANFGTMRGLFARNPAQALFGQSLGIERGSAYYGVDVENITMNNVFGNMPRVAIRSAITQGTNKLFLQNTGGAISDFGAGSAHFNDNVGVTFGNTLLLPDADIFFDGTNLILDPQTNAVTAAKVRIPTGGIIVEADAFPVSDFIRRAASTNLVLSSWRMTGQTSGDMADGFGTALFWTIEDDAAVKNNIAYQSAERFGADNTGIYRMWVYEAGVPNQIWEASGNSMNITGHTGHQGSVQYAPIAPAALSAGDNDDWDGLLTSTLNNNTRYWARVTGNVAGSSITGIDSTAVLDGDSFELTNVGTENILILPEEAGSLAANRIRTEDGFNHVLKPDGTATIRYDATTSRWRVTTPAGNVAPLTGFWKFSTTTTMADPGTGTFRVNNATPASVTSVAISDISFRGGDLSPILNLLSSGDVLYMQESANGANFIKFDITGVTDNGTWFQVDGTVSNSGTLFGNNRECAITSIFA